MENHHHAHDTHPPQRHHPHHFQSREILQHMDESGSHHWKPTKTLDSTPTNSIAPSAMAPKLMKMIRVEAPLLREIMAEFLGTFILVLFGDASVAQSKLSNEANGDFFSINWGWAIGVMMGVLVAGGVSGAHLNPAVTLAMACAGRLAIIKVFFYMLAQYLGAFAAAASVLGVYSDAIQSVSNGTLTMNEETQDPGLAGIFATYPAPWLSVAGGLGDQILGTMLLLLCICAITDKKNTQIPSALVPMYVGFTILGIGVCFGANCGYALNPARDLSPRLISLIAGWEQSFSWNNYNWFWIPIVGPHIGAILGVFIYIAFVEAHWPEDGDELVPANVPRGNFNKDRGYAAST
ncbi:aquaporin-9-like isoform X3 [Daphnia carinata]|uniref:aquaporin-9-like isoform X3 n=1 Tax=Daphnia carinata TaxID=120202 RepID=UPI002580D885|nr:aquaporin-9-like isoform X3 [Daphnia carinata]